MKANITADTCLDTMTRTSTVRDIIAVRDPKKWCNYTADGNVDQRLVDLVASRCPLPGIYVIEDDNGDRKAVGEYANDFISTMRTYEKECEDEPRILRRVLNTEIDVFVIRCNNKPENIDNLIYLLKSTNSMR